MWIWWNNIFKEKTKREEKKKKEVGGMCDNIVGLSIVPTFGHVIVLWIRIWYESTFPRDGLIAM